MLKTDQKKILLLGGSYAQVPAIKASKERGLYTILCDFLSDNPGQEFADEYINASTTDKEEILGIAKEQHVDYIFAYASDPAAPTAAFVSEKLGLPGNSYKSVKVLSEKHTFRQLLRDSGLNCPKSVSLNEEEVKHTDRLDLGYPLIIKPVDSSGSKGVKVINRFAEFPNAASYALSFSRSKRIIVEEFIDNDLGDIHGDGFVVDGKLKLFFMGDHIYNTKSNSFNPMGTLWPSKINEKTLLILKKDVQLVLNEVGFKNGGINIEARINSLGKLYLMEIGPRNGGHFVPKAIEYLCGIDMVQLGLDLAVGKIPNIEKEIVNNNYKKAVAYYAIHSDAEGVLTDVKLDKILDEYLQEKIFYKKPGEKIDAFRGANAAIGILLMVFPSSEIMGKIFSKIDSYVQLEIQT